MPKVIVTPNGVDLRLRRDAVECEKAGIAIGGNRCVYFLDEFASLSDEDYIDAVRAALIRRPPTMEERQVLSDRGPNWRNELLRYFARKQHVFIQGLASAFGENERIAVFLGSGHRPNLTGAAFLVADVAPRLPDVTFLIVGTVGESLDPTLLGPNCFATGFATGPLKERILRKAHLGLNPVIGGGGSNLKLPDYFAHGLPVVSSEFGARGFDFGEKYGLFRSSLSDFAQTILRVLSKHDKTAFDPRPALEMLKTNYAWTTISRIFLDAASEAFSAKKSGGCVVVAQSLAALVNPGLSHAASLALSYVKAGRVEEVIVEAEHLPADLAERLRFLVPRSVNKITHVAPDREWRLHNLAHMKHDSVLWHEVDVVETTASPQEIAAALDGFDIAVPVALSGLASVALSKDLWRYSSDRLIAAVPRQTRLVLVQGRAQLPTEIAITSADGTTQTSTVSGDFEISCPVVGPAVLLESRVVGPHGKAANRLNHQITRIATDIGDVVLDADLRANSTVILRRLGLPARTSTYFAGEAAPVLNREMECILAARAEEGGEFLLLGSMPFLQAATRIILQRNPNCIVRTHDGEWLRESNSAHSERALQPFSDAEIGLAANRKERVHLAMRHDSRNAVVLLVERFTSDVVKFAVDLQDMLDQGAFGFELVLVHHTEAPAIRAKESLADLMPGILIVAPGSKALLAILAEARLVVVRGCKLAFGRVPGLLDLVHARGAFWPIGRDDESALFDNLPCVASADDVIAMLTVMLTED